LQWCIKPSHVDDPYPYLSPSSTADPHCIRLSSAFACFLSTSLSIAPSTLLHTGYAGGTLQFDNLR
jgi:hypothetical protein